MKYDVDRNKEADRVPQEMEKYADLAVFSEKRFEELKVTNIEVVK